MSSSGGSGVAVAAWKARPSGKRASTKSRVPWSTRPTVASGSVAGRSALMVAAPSPPVSYT
ncbi:hypothetical protein [Frankia nepalensis]|uniref:hypothetical protein n=1 Tax=Frankia nepalensis TaxID=1836974 RepID=UPI0027DABA80|nr:hypothetical protein [Frankia nepalensis]